jgi:hypothetical protein
MRLKLELEDRLTFSTVNHPTMGRYRTLMVKVGERTFNAWRTCDPVEIYFSDERYMQEVDRQLVLAMEQMLGKIFREACAAVPVGVELL